MCGNNSYTTLLTTASALNGNGNTKYSGKPALDIGLEQWLNRLMRHMNTDTK